MGRECEAREGRDDLARTGGGGSSLREATQSLRLRGHGNHTQAVASSGQEVPPQPPNSVVTASTMMIAARNGSSLTIRQNFSGRVLAWAAKRFLAIAR